MLLSVCSLMVHRRRQNKLRTLVRHLAAPSETLTFLQHFNVIYYRTNAWQDGI